jgi:MFS family permease
MVKLLSSSLSRIETGTAFRSVMLVVNPLVWYYAAGFYLQNVLSEMSSNHILVGSDTTLIWSVHFAGIIFSALAGTLLSKKIATDRFLLIWMILGVISPLSLLAINTSSLLITCSIVLFLGVSLGLGMPACMGYYTNSIPIENRGRVSGVVMGFTAIGIVAFTLFPSTNPLLLATVLAGWRLASLLVFRGFKPQAIPTSNKENPSYKRVLSQPSFVLYLIPWVMFSLVNYLAGPVQSKIVEPDAAVLMSAIQNVMMGVFAFVGGFLLDLVGRKRIAIAGFVMLGIDAAALGMFPKELLANYFSATIDGIAWGFLWVIFIVTIWGDLSNHENSSKYYAIGVLPFFLSKFLALTVGNDMSSSILKVTGENGLFSFLAFFLFLAVLPLIYAPETLPEKVMKDRDLKSYLEKAKKKVKEAEKIIKPEPAPKTVAEKPKEDFIEFEIKPSENGKEDEEAARLAEKYY